MLTVIQKIVKTSEKETREKIDGQLEDSGWTILKRGEPIPDKGASEEYPTSSGPADYVLVVEGNSIGIVEAKKSGESVYGVLTQAQRYARDIEGTTYKFDDSEEALTTIDGEEIKSADYLKAALTNFLVIEIG